MTLLWWLAWPSTASRALGALILLEAEADIQISALGEIKAFKKVMEGRTAEFDNAKSAFMAWAERSQ